MDPDEALAAIRSTRIGYNRRVVEEYVEDEATLIRRIRPDVILNDFRLPVAISARLTGIPFANILNAYWTNYYAPRRRAPEDFPLTRLVGKRRATSILPPIMKLVLALYARPFNAVAAAHGMERFRNIFDVMDSPHLNLVCDLAEFMPLAGAPERFKVIGPILWEPGVAPPEWLGRVEGGRPTIYFSMGSTGFGRYYDALRKAFEGTDFQVLVTTGGSTDAGEMPANFFVTDLAPALALIERSSLVICHGGNGTIYQALAEGVPVLGIPTFHDQDFNMQRVEDLGLGAALYPKTLTAKSLRETAERLMGDERIRAAARGFAVKIAATNAVGAAVKSVEMLARP
jgi:MGT family glycosyltransferase